MKARVDYTGMRGSDVVFLRLNRNTTKMEVQGYFLFNEKQAEL